MVSLKERETGGGREGEGEGRGGKERRDAKKRTQSPVARDEHDRLLVERSAEPVRADIALRELGERGYVLDADDDACSDSDSGSGSGSSRASLLRGVTGTASDEVVQDAREVARSRADVENARAAAGMAVQIWEEELHCVRVLVYFILFYFIFFGGWAGLGAMMSGWVCVWGGVAWRDVPCAGQRWSLRG